LLLFLGAVVALWPEDLTRRLLGAAAGIPAFLSPTPADNAGNSTAILLASALASLSCLRPGRSSSAPLLVALLGIAAGFGA
jgi:sugar/nucleoside kinase (ribokinase family)